MYILHEIAALIRKINNGCNFVNLNYYNNYQSHSQTLLVSYEED